MRYLLYVCLLILVGCSPVAMPKVTTFTLQPATHVARMPTKAQTLLVSLPIAAPGFKSNKIAYSQTAYEIKYFTRNEWLEPPAQLVQQNIQQILQNSGRFRAVVIEPFTASTDLRLDTQLSDFSERIHLATHTREFVFVLRATLVDQISNRIIKARTFSVTVPVTQNTVYSMVQSANIAVAAVLQQLAVFCRE